MTPLPVDHTFVISLASRLDRRERALSGIFRAGLRAEVFEAVDAKALGLSTSVRSPLLVEEGNQQGFIPSGRIGSFLSRLALYNECARRGLGNVLVFEEDIELVDDFYAKASVACSALPDDWEMLYFGHWDWAMERAVEVNDYIVKPGRPMLSHAILFRGGVYARLAEGMREMRETHDLQISELKIVRYATKEKLAMQR